MPLPGVKEMHTKDDASFERLGGGLLTQQQPVTAGRCLKPRRAGVDRTLLLILSLLMMCGLLALFSATYYKAVDQGDALLEVKRQLVGIGLGAVLMLITSRIPHAFWADPRVVVAGLAALAAGAVVAPAHGPTGQLWVGAGLTLAALGGLGLIGSLALARLSVRGLIRITDAMRRKRR